MQTGTLLRSIKMLVKVNNLAITNITDTGLTNNGNHVINNYGLISITDTNNNSYLYPYTKYNNENYLVFDPYAFKELNGTLPSVKFSDKSYAPKYYCKHANW